MKLVTGHDNGSSRRSGSGSGRGSGGSGSGSSSAAGGVRLVTSVRHRHPPHSSTEADWLRFRTSLNQVAVCQSEVYRLMYFYELLLWQETQARLPAKAAKK